MRKAPVNAMARLETIKKRGKEPLIYHQVNVTQPYSTLNLEFEVDVINMTRLVVLGRHNKMPTINNCEFVKIIGNIQARDSDCKYFNFDMKLLLKLRIILLENIICCIFIVFVQRWIY